jgi:hypothetical protein
MKTNMKLSFYGRAIHFYMWFGKFFTKVIYLFMFLLIVSALLILFVPQFSLNKVGFRVSSSGPLAIAQAIVGITFLVSLVLGAVLGVVIGSLALIEIPIEIRLKKRVYKLVKERGKMSLDELVNETGVLENDLSFLLKNWIMKPGMDTYKVNLATGKIKRGHLQIDLEAKELTWQE